MLPVNEDPDLALKFKQAVIISESKKEAEAIIIKNESPLKRRNTINEATIRKKIKLPATISSGTAKKFNRQKTMVLGKDSEKIEELDENIDADDEKEDAKSDKIEEKDVVMEMKDGNTDVIHKKRRRKNVESRDAFTQTDRSDYMLIKQRQVAKLKQANI